MRKHYNTQTFIEAVKEKFPCFDYSKTNYISMQDEVTIICPKHGEQNINAFRLLNKSKYGCPKCGRNASKEFKTKSREQFIKEAKQLHGNKYDYSKVIYISSDTKVKIICPEHGIFEQLPSNHIKKDKPQGCPECTRHYWSNDEFLERVKKYHGNKYDYSKINYNGEWSKIEVICPKHGNWFPYAHNFASESNHCGCPKCKESNGERSVRVWLENHNINYKSEFRFSECKDKEELPFDFYLKEKNTVIEFQGKQHYKISTLWKDNNKFFLKRKHHDWLKRKFARDNNIKYLAIPYWELPNLNKILEEQLL